MSAYKKYKVNNLREFNMEPVFKNNLENRIVIVNSINSSPFEVSYYETAIQKLGIISGRTGISTKVSVGQVFGFLNLYQETNEADIELDFPFTIKLENLIPDSSKISSVTLVKNKDFTDYFLMGYRLKE